MDVVRYADTAGDNADYPVPEARKYRDYIIDAFNADMPFDQFICEQIAGDILACQHPSERYAEQVVATGFLALSRRYGTGPYELWHLTLEDTIDTVGRSIMGLTLKCARCHDHKFDPITTEDYYALYGIFASTQFPWAGGEEFTSKKTHRLHFVPTVPDDEAKPVVAAFHARVEQLSAEIETLEKKLPSAGESQRADVQQRVNELRDQLFRVQRAGLPPELPGAYAVREGTPHDVFLQVAGDPSNTRQVVPRDAIKHLSIAPLAISPGESGRLQLARWLTRSDHPLTPRVIVNRIWQHHFGRGIVATPSNFGKSGALPTHPELLDYLAAEFVAHGWSIKQLHRLILTSQTWQLSSADSLGQ